MYISDWALCLCLIMGIVSLISMVQQTGQCEKWQYIYSKEKYVYYMLGILLLIVTFFTCYVLNYVITLHWSFSHYGMNWIKIAKPTCIFHENCSYIWHGVCYFEVLMNTISFSVFVILNYLSFVLLSAYLLQYLDVFLESLE